MAVDAQQGAVHLLATLRRLLRWLLLFELAALGVELTLLQHYEDPWQFVPLVLIGAALVLLIWHSMDRSAVPLRLWRATMVCCLAAGALGIVLHYRSNLAIQLDADPHQPGWQLFTRILHSEAPPALAPGAMAQIGLLGLVYAYRFPALIARRSSTTEHGA